MMAPLIRRKFSETSNRSAKTLSGVITKYLKEHGEQVDYSGEKIMDVFYIYLARRMVKEALMYPEYNTLWILGLMSDRGIYVKIKSKGNKGKTDTNLYEPGNMLKAVGVHSDKTKGRENVFLNMMMTDLEKCIEENNFPGYREQQGWSEVFPDTESWDTSAYNEPEGDNEPW